MKAIYRGIGHEVPMGIENLAVVGNHRPHQGQLWERPYVRHIPVPGQVGRSSHQTILHRDPLLRSTLPTSPGNDQSLAQSNITQNIDGETQRVCPDRLQNLQKLANAYHQLAIQRRLEHRLQVAKARQDEALVKMLETEFVQFQQTA